MERSLAAATFAGPRFCLQGMVNSVPFRASAMNITGLGTDRLRLKLRIMSDDDLWWLFLHHREECSHEFWEELETRKAAGTLSKDSPFWAMGKPQSGHFFRGGRGTLTELHGHLIAAASESCSGILQRQNRSPCALLSFCPVLESALP